MEKLHQLIGSDHELGVVAQKLRMFASRFGAPAVGGFHVTCSDEAEQECVNAFFSGFTNFLLPNLKSGKRSHFRSANLGGRYEWGSLPVAESHFAIPESSGDFKLLCVKLNSHVSVEWSGDRPTFGCMDRYGAPDTYCGALHALLDGQSRAPFIADLADVFASEHIDRLGILRDRSRVDPRARSLFVAISNARLQARNAVLEAQHHRASSPTVYAIIPCVTLNQQGPDREIVVGLYSLDYLGSVPVETYVGLGDNPSAYRLDIEDGRVRVSDDSIRETRSARNHRELVRAIWSRSNGARRVARTPELDDALKVAASAGHGDHPVARASLKTLLRLLANLNPVTAAALVFAEGAAEIRHAHRVHRAVRGGSEEDARVVVEHAHDSIDSLEAEQVIRLRDALVRECLAK